ncbi:B-cell scaffold protein with ankyrin repeats [Ctenodactylus gundi]
MTCAWPFAWTCWPGNLKDIVIIFEEDAEAWAWYLRDLFSLVVKAEAILLYCLESFSLRHLEFLGLNSYKCKLLILSSGLLKDLPPKKSEFLAKVLATPDSVVTLLRGMESSDPLYRSLRVSRSRWEISTEQEPEELVSVIKQVVFTGLTGLRPGLAGSRAEARDRQACWRGARCLWLHLMAARKQSQQQVKAGVTNVGVTEDAAARGLASSEDCLEVSIPADIRVKQPKGLHERKKTEHLPEPSSSAKPLARVLPAEVPCEHPGEIFIILRDEVICETMEVEFMSSGKCIRRKPTRWDKKVWCMKALDFPAGSVSVSVYCDGAVKATAEMRYYAAAMAAERPPGAPDAGEGLRTNDLQELDDALTSTFQHEIAYEFRDLPAEVCPQNENAHIKELPTLLHFAARFGLKKLAVHLLQCPGAMRACMVKSTNGLNPAHVAEKHGHEELKKVFEDFSIQEIFRNNEEKSDSEENRVLSSANSPSTECPGFQGASRIMPRQRTGGEGPPEPEDEDLYASIPEGINPEVSAQPPRVGRRPPAPPPRPGPGKEVDGSTARSQTWSDPAVRQEVRDEPKEQEKKVEDPYSFAEIDSNDYDMILESISVKKKTESRSFIMNRPPAPTPRPRSSLPKEETTPYIAQVFQQKAARRQSDSYKFYSLPRNPVHEGAELTLSRNEGETGRRPLGMKAVTNGKQDKVPDRLDLTRQPAGCPTGNRDKAWMESQAFSTPTGCLAAGQKELILLQEKVKNGKMSVDEALEKFKHWQMKKSCLEVIQQEKLRQLRDSIIGKRPGEENVYDKLVIVHHPSALTVGAEETARSRVGGVDTQKAENRRGSAGATAAQATVSRRRALSRQSELRSWPVLVNAKKKDELPARLQDEKEFGFSCKEDH